MLDSLQGSHRAQIGGRQDLAVAFTPLQLLPETAPPAEECVIRSELPVVGAATASSSLSASGQLSGTIVGSMSHRCGCRESQRMMEFRSEMSAAASGSSLAPDIIKIKGLLDGMAPARVTAELPRRLSDVPPSWPDQRRLLGFPNF